MKKFASTLTNQEIAYARKIEANGWASFSQAVKAIERGEIERKVAEWIAAKNTQNS